MYEYISYIIMHVHKYIYSCLCMFKHIYAYPYMKNFFTGIIYRVCQNDRQIFRAQVKRTKLSRKVFYHFTIFTLVHKILITRSR